MSALDDIMIDLTIVLGSANVPIRQILHMGRGAMIPLDNSHDDPTQICVNGKVVAEGRILVAEDQMSIEVTQVNRRGIV